MRDIVQVVMRDGQPDNPKLFLLAQHYANERNLGSLSGLARFWCVVEQEDTTNGNAPEPKVTGILGGMPRFDICVCHVDDETSRPRLIQRAYHTLMDLGIKEVLQYVDPAVEEFIAERYLEKMGARRANRWMIAVQPKVSV